VGYHTGLALQVSVLGYTTLTSRPLLSFYITDLPCSRLYRV
jgi:hypothetical protein